MTRRRIVFIVTGVALVACGIEASGIDPGPAPPDPALSDSGPSFEAHLPPKSEYESSVPDSGCGSTIADTENCGECGRKCASCGNSVCVPEVLHEGMNEPIAIGLDNDFAFVAEHAGGRIFRVDLSGATKPLMIFDTGQMPRAVDVNGDHVFWVEQTKVRSVLHDGGGADGRDLGDLGTATLLLGNQVVFTDHDGGRVIRRNTDYGQERILGNDEPKPFGLAANDDFIYWTSNVPDGGIKRFARDAGSDEEGFLTGEDRPSSIAVGPANVFWTTPTAIRSSRVDRSAPAADLYANRDAPTSLVRNGAFLYWIEPKKGWIVRGKTDGTSTLVLAVQEAQNDDLDITSGLAVDAVYVYWVSTKDGTLKRVPK